MFSFCSFQDFLFPLTAEYDDLHVDLSIFTFLWIYYTFCICGLFFNQNWNICNHYVLIIIFFNLPFLSFIGFLICVCWPCFMVSEACSFFFFYSLDNYYWFIFNLFHILPQICYLNTSEFFISFVLFSHTKLSFFSMLSISSLKFSFCSVSVLILSYK